MSTTVENLADRAQAILSDTAASTWSQATVEAWVKEAIRDYSQYFHRVDIQTVTLVATSGHDFDLPANFLGMISVEYPAGDDPPNLLRRYSRTQPSFWGAEGYYDLEPKGDAAELGVIYFSEEPAIGETYILTYLTPHNADLDSADTITVPSEHEHLLILFIVWQAFKERQSKEIQDPDTTIYLLQQMVRAANQAENEYRTALKGALKREATGGWTGPWATDVHDPIY